MTTLAPGERFRLRVANLRDALTSVTLKVDGVNVLSTGSWVPLAANETRTFAGFEDVLTGAVTPFVLTELAVEEGAGGGGLRAQALAAGCSAGEIAWTTHEVTLCGATTITMTNVASPTAPSSAGKKSLLNGLVTATPVFSAGSRSTECSSSLQRGASLGAGVLRFRDRSAVLLLLGDAEAKAAAARQAAARAANPPGHKRVTRAADAAAVVVEESDSGSAGGGAGGARKTKRARREEIVKSGAQCPFTSQPLKVNEIWITSCGHPASSAGRDQAMASAKWAQECTVCLRKGITYEKL